MFVMQCLHKAAFIFFSVFFQDFDNLQHLSFDPYKLKKEPSLQRK